MDLSQVDFSTNPPTVVIPPRFNAARDLLERNIAAGRADKIAFIDDDGSYSIRQLLQRVDGFAHGLHEFGVQLEQRIVLCLRDSIDFPTAFLGAIKAGVVPIPVSTLLTPPDYQYVLYDSRALVLVVSEALLPQFRPILGQSPFLKHVVVAGTSASAPAGSRVLRDIVERTQTGYAAAPTHRDESCFWLYSSGSTGLPKGTVHAHSRPIQTATYFAQAVLGLNTSDVTLSAAKLFFAYGLGNSLTFPLAVGATAVLMADRPTPELIMRRLQAHGVTIFSGVPTLFASLLASDVLSGGPALALRACVSAGESLPETVARRWYERTGVEIVDGIGSTEMLHIFLSNRPGRIRPGTLGVPVPGYDTKIVDQDGVPVPSGEIGELLVSGPTSAKLYWNQHDRSRATFQGIWTRTGDRFRINEDGDYVYMGRADDMLKVGGIYVSPIEVESALVAHPAVREAAVVGREHADRLVKPCAFVVLTAGQLPSDELATELKAHIKSQLAPYKYPRWIEFVPELPKTATGKIQRFKLRESLAR
jgi:benzoate-CoA ligase